MERIVVISGGVSKKSHSMSDIVGTDERCHRLNIWWCISNNPLPSFYYTLLLVLLLIF